MILSNITSAQMKLVSGGWKNNLKWLGINSFS
jgi:hypothetical protein